MQFLFPGFLFALISVAIPVIIHLFNFRKFKKVYFSNVAFLREIQQQTSSSRNLKHLLLLLARIFTLIFLILAFAQPIIPLSNQKSGFEKQTVSIYIDNSYSMEALNKEGSLLDEAKRRAKEIAAAYNINDKFQLLTNDFEGKHQRLLSYEDFNKAVEGVKISALSKNLEQVIARQQDVISGEPNSDHTIYIISDFQKTILPNTVKYNASENLRFILLEANAQANISVDSVWFASLIHRPGETEKLIVQLKNNSDKLAENIPIKVLIDGKQRALGSLSLAPRATNKDTLSFSGLNSGWKRGEVRISDYPIIFDDIFHFTFKVDQQMSILAIHSQTENIFLKSLYSAERFFNYKNVQMGSLDYSQLSKFPLILLTETEQISTGLAEQLETYVKNGGNLVVFPSLEKDLAGLKTLSQVLKTDYPATIQETETRVISLNLQHSIFRGVFSKVPDKIDLPLAKRYVQFSNSSRGTKQNILQLPGNRSFLSQYNHGKGRVYISAVALTEESSNFVRHSIFVPIMYQIAFLSLRDNRLFYSLGKDQYLEAQKIYLSPNQSLKLRKGNYEAIPDMRQSESGTRLFISDQIKEKGNYELVKGDSVLSVFAFNDNRQESDLSYLSKSDLKKRFNSKNVEIFTPQKGSVQNEIKAVNNGVQLWKLCLILALVFLAAEILLIRFYKSPSIKNNL